MAEIDRLKEIVETLRSENGCPWDRVQTHESLKASVIEEAAEVICGINILEETKNPENLKEELGDLLLQIMFHAVMAEEEGLFTFDDVVKGISDKMVRRHPHVFSGVTYASEEEMHEAWAKIKKEEKAGKEWHEDYLPSAFKEATQLIKKAEERKGYTGETYMIYVKPTPNLTGICIEGEYLDFYEMVESIYRMTGLEDDYYDPYWGVKSRLLGLCYDIRHAYQGDCEVSFVDNGVYDQLEKWHKKIMPKQNVHYSVNILFPEAVFVALSVSDLFIFSKKYYDPSREDAAHSEDVHLCDFMKDKANLEMLSGVVLGALGEVIGDDGFRQILKEIERIDHKWEAPFYHYITHYVDRCNIEYLNTPVEKRKDKLRNIAKRFVKPPQSYLSMKRDFDYSAKQQNCSIYQLYDPKSDKYPEDIEW